MLLKKLIKNCPNELKKIKVRGLSSDTRKLKKGDLFFALKGFKEDGNKYIYEAFNKGACAVISSKKLKENSKVIKVDNVRYFLGKTCDKFFNSKPKNIFAVTGTNGKSSVAEFFHQILTLNNIPVATIGTLGIKIKNFKKNNLTSPDVISLHKELAKIKKKKIENVMIEASSHGLAQGRLDGINIKTGIFTNFSQDHLDYHKNMKNYLNAKLILFKKMLKENSSVITDNNIQEFQKIKKIILKKRLRLLLIKSFQNKYDLKNFELIGNFQKKNLMMAIIASELCGLNRKKISKSFEKLKNVKGRLELVKIFPNGTKVFVDFAHTPEAISIAIDALKSHFRKNITIVFGCGGERDKDKRKKIGKIVNKTCKKIYVTDDNPRNENPKKIRKSILKYIEKRKVTEIGNRSKAINEAIKNSKPDEIILIAGKGHEDIQDYGKMKIKISDFKIINRMNIKKNNSKKNNDITENNILINQIVHKKIDKGFLGVSIDSKSVKKGNLFIAIKGKKNDGHNFLKEANTNGANFCVISKQVKKISKNKLIKVTNTHSFLNKLAQIKRYNSNSKIVAVTGSSGKTSVKDLVGNLLKYFGKTYFSPKSYNNSYGVPLSLSNLEQSHKFGVFEIGMSKAGEIDKLSKLVKPDIGIITNIAEAHIENFKNLRQIAIAKGEIINNISPKGSLIIDRDSKYFSYFKSEAEKKKINVTSVGYNKNSNIRITKIKNFSKFKIVKIKSKQKEYEFKINNKNVKNISFAIAVLECLNLKIKKIENKIKNIKTLEGRGKIYKVKLKNINFNLIDESYNANPLSMKESIHNLSNIKINSSKYVLLGDMLELGSKSKKLHKNLSPIINNADIRKLFIYGDNIMDTYTNVKKNKRGNILQHKSDFDEILLPILKNNDYLMIKGSNATGLNKISKNLTKGKINAV